MAYFIFLICLLLCLCTPSDVYFILSIILYMLCHSVNILYLVKYMFYFLNMWISMFFGTFEVYTSIFTPFLSCYVIPSMNRMFSAFCISTATILCETFNSWLTFCTSPNYFVLCYHTHIICRPCTVKPVDNDHLMGNFSAFWGSSRWPRAT